jgi:hypothetical protein
MADLRDSSPGGGPARHGALASPSTIVLPQHKLKQHCDVRIGLHLGARYTE